MDNQYHAHCAKAAKGSQRLRDAIFAHFGLVPAKPIRPRRAYRPPQPMPTLHLREAAAPIARIKTEVAKYYRIPVSALTSPSREQKFAWPRQLAMHLIRTETNASLPIIGREFGGRDHTTVMHAISAVEKRIAEVRRVRDAVRTIKRRLAVDVGQNSAHPAGDTEKRGA